VKKIACRSMIGIAAMIGAGCDDRIKRKRQDDDSQLRASRRAPRISHVLKDATSLRPAACRATTR
jgi:hypothetical protein